MERPAFELLHGMENSWWYRGRALTVNRVLNRVYKNGIGKALRVLDFGAGFGGMHKTLSPHGSVFAFEPDTEARAVAQERGYSKIYDNSKEALSHTYDLVGLFDVLEHIP